MLIALHTSTYCKMYRLKLNLVGAERCEGASQWCCSPSQALPGAEPGGESMTSR